MTNKLEVPDAVASRAVLLGASGWLDSLPELLAELCSEWGLAPGRVYDGGTEAHVLDVDMADGVKAVLKLAIPREGNNFTQEIDVLTVADGQGCAKLLAADPTRNALLIERLGPSLFDLAPPVAERLEIMCAAVSRLWRPSPNLDLPTGADKAAWLIDSVVRTWEEMDRPIPRSVVDHAIACGEARGTAHHASRAVLVHGDVHQWNTLRTIAGNDPLSSPQLTGVTGGRGVGGRLKGAAEGSEFKLVDPDGLLAEPEYDLGILMREDPLELLEEGPRTRSAWLAQRCELDEQAIWEWGVIERVSTGLTAMRIGLEPVGTEMLEAATAIAMSK